MFRIRSAYHWYIYQDLFTMEAVIFMGMQATGKSTFYWYTIKTNREALCV